MVLPSTLGFTMKLNVLLVLVIIQGSRSWWLWGEEENEETAPVLELELESAPSQDSSAFSVPVPSQTLDSSPGLETALNSDKNNVSEIVEIEEEQTINFSNPGIIRDYKKLFLPDKILVD